MIRCIYLKYNKNSISSYFPHTSASASASAKSHMRSSSPSPSSSSSDHKHIIITNISIRKISQIILFLLYAYIQSTDRDVPTCVCVCVCVQAIINKLELIKIQYNVLLHLCTWDRYKFSNAHYEKLPPLQFTSLQSGIMLVKPSAMKPLTNNNWTVKV